MGACRVPPPVIVRVDVPELERVNPPFWTVQSVLIVLESVVELEPDLAEELVGHESVVPDVALA